ncbi:hypothetical protein [Paraburkholderia sp. GAS348]|uniref:hypothetical protein n=1 Tax=Paraburkholderia sp. GAS348 TaxID=3035132 RepID=UPI003D1F154D
MKRLNRISEWLLHFASSQKNIDRVAMWFGGGVSVLAATFTVAVIVMLLRRRAMSANDMGVDGFPKCLCE